MNTLLPESLMYFIVLGLVFGSIESKKSTYDNEIGIPKYRLRLGVERAATKNLESSVLSTIGK
jgi:hypothetical protein